MRKKTVNDEPKSASQVTSFSPIKSVDATNIALPAPQTNVVTSDFQPLTDAEMEAELATAETQETQQISESSVDTKIKQASALRELGHEAEARALLYQVLDAGNKQQKLVARNILEQLDL